jgi:two-component system sensor histidine kinase/response regulator
LQDESWDKAELLAHTLKGVSANVGASALQQRAQQLKDAIREHRPLGEMNTLLGELEVPLGRLTAQLEDQLPEQQGNKKVTVDGKDLKAVCDRLAPSYRSDCADNACRT